MSKANAKRPTVREGMIVAVPATDGHGFIIGVVARAEPSRSRGAAILVYFFRPRWPHTPSQEQVGELLPETALSIIQTGVLRIIDETWMIVGDVQSFDRAMWPIPIFGSISNSEPIIAWLTRFKEDRIGYGAPREEIIVSPEEARRYPECSSWGVDIAAYEATIEIQNTEKKKH